MNQKTVVIALGVVVLVFVGVFAFLGEEEGAQFGEPVVSEEVMAEPAAAEESSVRPQGKIDVRVACESALMYTTFTDGVAADAFIEECIEGKHPEVIERFISEMGVDGAMI